MVNYVYTDGNGHKAARPVTNRTDYLALRNKPENVKNFNDARAGDKEAKANQTQFNYNDLLPDGVVKGCCHPSSTFAHDIDCGCAEEQERIKNVLLAKKEEIGLLELSGSAGYGLHAVCRRPLGKTVRECQYALSMATQTEYDTNARGLARVMFTGPATPDNLFYLDDDIFAEPLTVEESEAEYERLKKREKNEEEEVPAMAKKAVKHYRPWEKTPSLTPDPSPRGEGSDYPAAIHTADLSPQSSNFLLLTSSSTTPSERTRFIAEGVMKEKGLQRRDFLDEGGRHTAVKVLLSGATQLLRREEVNGVLSELMPDHWKDENIQQLVSDFYQNYTKPNQRLMRYQEQLFVESRRAYPSPPQGRDVQTADCATSSGIPEMPKRLPKLVELLTSRTPEPYKAAVAHAVFPPLATHLCGVRFTYTDKVEHEATLMNCLMAGTGSGKGCIDKPIERIMADIKRRDEENEHREKEWKKDCVRRADNKDKLSRPEGLVIQIIDSDMTKPALVTRLDEAEGHFVYVKLNELDLFEQLKGPTGKQHFQLMCLAFDPGAEYGQTRIGTQSVTARPRCRFNWNACTTILKGRKFFNRVLTDGPISRINFCTLPEEEIGAEQPVYGQYDAEFDEQLKPYIDRLVAARGLIDCGQAYRLAKKLQQECADSARLTQSETYWNLSHRACVIAWLKACVLYVANGQKWEKPIEDFIRWSLQYDLWCKMQFFGADIDRANSGEDSRIGKRGPQNLLELLPDEFTIDDAKRVRLQQGLDNSGNKCRNMINQWVHRKYVLQMTNDSFKKTD